MRLLAVLSVVSGVAWMITGWATNPQSEGLGVRGGAALLAYLSIGFVLFWTARGRRGLTVRLVMLWLLLVATMAIANASSFGWAALLFSLVLGSAFLGLWLVLPLVITAFVKDGQRSGRAAHHAETDPEPGGADKPRH